MAGIRVTVRARARNGCSFGPAHPRPKAVAEMALADRPPVRQDSPGSAVPKAEKRTPPGRLQLPGTRGRNKRTRSRCALFPLSADQLIRARGHERRGRAA